MTDEKKFWELSKEEQEKQIREELKEIAHWLGGWAELRKVIDELENNANEAAYDRAYSRY